MRSLRRHHRRLPLHPSARLLSSTTTSRSTTNAHASSSSSAPSSFPHSSSSSSSSSTTPPLNSLLIANRGEIALRINRTAAKLGIPTTTLYTPVDASSQHARCSPHSVAIGSYLDGDRIIDLATQRGIKALHPGYGFLSENAAFAKRCEAAGITFVGPPASAMADMGDKARSKEIMTNAGVACVPGYHGAEQEVAQLAGHAEKIGYPVLLKSVKGGGGKGMRIVTTAGEFETQLRSARAEARASFGEGGEVMLVEKYIVRPRHVEVQVFADTHGNCVALGERDCSVQRRHQKILEESPAPGLEESLRQDLWEKARMAASAVGYVGAGTVEFILDRDTDEFYFMEMNTRLQVEHPVSEMVTGTDLVEWQLSIAAGATLPLTQPEIEQRIQERGAAIEARIYAESPEKEFMPDSGKLVHLTTPPTSEAVRIDAGFVQGDTVSEAYDGMIAKLIVRGRSREEAIKKLDAALQEYEVVGLSTNIEFLKRLCRSPAFIEGDVETGFIDKHRGELFEAKRVDGEVFVQAALGLLRAQVREEAGSPSAATQSGPHGLNIGFGAAQSPTSTRRYAFRVSDGYSQGDGQVVEVAVSQTGYGLYSARVTRKGSKTSPEIEAEEEEGFSNIASEDVTASSSSSSSSPTQKQNTSSTSSTTTTTTLRSFFPSSRIESTVVQQPPSDVLGGGNAAHSVTVFQRGRKTELTLVQPVWFEKALGLKEATASVVAPMPCKILKNEVVEGQSVEKGEPLVVIESMKMETVIRSPQNGIIKKLAHKEGDICKAGTTLVLFQEEAPGESEEA